MPPNPSRTEPAAVAMERLPLVAAFRFGALVVGVLAIAVGAVARALELLPAELLPYGGAGLGAALFAAMLALWIHSRFLDGRHQQPFARDGRLMASRLQGLLAAAFGAKLGVLLLAVFALRVAGVKFALLAAFCITFAAVALVCQLAIAAYLSRVMSRRWRTDGQDAMGRATPLSQAQQAPR